MTYLRVALPAPMPKRCTKPCRSCAFYAPRLMRERGIVLPRRAAPTMDAVAGIRSYEEPMRRAKLQTSASKCVACPFAAICMAVEINGGRFYSVRYCKRAQTNAYAVCGGRQLGEKEAALLWLIPRPVHLLY